MMIERRRMIIGKKGEYGNRSTRDINKREANLEREGKAIINIDEDIV